MIEPARAWILLGSASLLAWVYLWWIRSGFWRCDVRLEDEVPNPRERGPWPSVCAVVPARDEAETIEASLRSLLDQDYAGAFRIVVVDDQSRDGTLQRALRLAETHPRGVGLSGLRTPPRPPGWVGKMWAVHTGVASPEAARRELLWLTDADIVHDPSVLRRLVETMEKGTCDLVSTMVLLECRGGWQRLLIPAFVYFFQALYPFRRVNDPRSRTAAAAGGSLLVRRTALEHAGGIERIRGEVIDDCALARAVQESGGRLWLGLTTLARSARGYSGLGGVWGMVARSAYTQLSCSPALLLVTVLAIGVVDLAPVVLALGPPSIPLAARACGGLAWALMARTFVPTLRLYGLGAWRGWLLPLAALSYLGMTLDSARRHVTGRGATWKGRVGAGAGENDPRSAGDGWLSRDGSRPGQGGAG